MLAKADGLALKPPRGQGYSCRVLEMNSVSGSYELVDATEVVEVQDGKQGGFVFGKKVLMDYFCRLSLSCLLALTDLTSREEAADSVRTPPLERWDGRGSCQGKTETGRSGWPP